VGAELIIESIGFKAKDRCRIDEEWTAAAFAKARHEIAIIDESRLAEINRDASNSYDDIETCQEDLTGDIAELELAVVGSHRQAAMIEGGKGIMLLVSGGLSWGDSPGKLFDSMLRLIAVSVFPDARWPKDP
jgi:hypothetical protein